MPEVLSQSQIDELLSGLSSGEIDYEQINQKNNTKKVKEYDFRSPKKLTKEQLKVLRSIYEIFARHLANYFSGILRTYCEVSVSTIEEQPYYEYNNALPDAVLIGVLDAKPIEGSVLVDMSNTITFALIDRLLGGPGDASVISREYTEIEITLMETIYKRITQFMKDAWAHYIDITTSIKQIETNARLVQAIPMDEVVAIIVMDIGMKSVRGNISFCIPCINLEGIIEKLSFGQFSLKRKSDAIHDDELKNTMFSKVKESQIEVHGILGETFLSMNEVLNLQVGDVIKLDQRLDSNVKLRINNKTWFHGVPGIKRSKKVIKVNEVL